MKAGVGELVSVSEQPQAGTWVVIELPTNDQLSAEFGMQYVYDASVLIVNDVTMQGLIIMVKVEVAGVIKGKVARLALTVAV